VCIFLHSPLQAIFSSDIFPRDKQLHFTAGAPVEPGVEYTFGPWRVMCEPVDEPLADNHAKPVSMWDVLTGRFSYAIPHPDDVDTGASEEDSAAPGRGDVPTGLRLAVAPRMPPLRGMQRALRAALPLVVVGPDRDGTECDDEEDEGGGGGEEDDGELKGEPTFRVRAWTPSELACSRCMRVSIRYERTRRRGVHDGEA